MVVVNISASLYVSKVYLSEIKTHYLEEIIPDEVALINTALWPLCKTKAVYHVTNERLEDDGQVVPLSSWPIDTYHHSKRLWKN